MSIFKNFYSVFQRKTACRVFQNITEIYFLYILENFTQNLKRSYKLLGTTFKTKDDTKTEPSAAICVLAIQGLSTCQFRHRVISLDTV